MKRTVAINGRGLRVGEDHQNARYTNGEVERVLELREEGMSYNRIARLMDMPKSTVASICRHERRAVVVVAWRTVHVPG